MNPFSSDASQTQSVSSLSLSRLQSLSDGVFGVAITLLILNIALPVLTSGDPMQYSAALVSLWPKVLVYGLTFFLIGIFWFGHYLMFHYIKYADRSLIWINNLLLMSVCFIPFAANVMGNYPFLYPSYLVYGATLFCASIPYFVIWKYAVHKRLIMQDLSPAFVKQATIVVTAAPLLYIVATLCVFVSIWLSLALFIVVPLLYIIPSPIDDLFPRE